MNFDPQKFFIGLMDVFPVLLPSALLTWLLMGQVGPVVMGDSYGQLTGAQTWAGFLLASYLLGNLVLQLASKQGELCDRTRRHAPVNRSDFVSFGAAKRRYFWQRESSHD